MLRTHFDMAHLPRVSAGSVLCCILLAQVVLAQQKPNGATSAAPRRAAVVQLNGRHLAEAVVVQTPRGQEVFVPVIALARALDGPAGTIGNAKTAKASGSARLRLDGNKLFAASHGGCDDCPARVSRLVVISTRVRTSGGSPALPLADLVAAFEGTLEIDSTKTLYAIHAGKCTWCILGPR
jgi:hypothetical protein